MADKTISGLDALGAIGDVTDATVFEVQIPGGDAPESRKITWLQLKTLLAEAAGGTKKRVPFVYRVAGSPHDHVVSAGVTRVDIECLAGGGGAASDSGGTNNIGAGAGGGYAMKAGITVAEGDHLTVTVGAGGVANDGADGTAGGDSKVEDALATDLCHALGGNGAEYAVGPTIEQGGFGFVYDISLVGGASLAGTPGGGPSMPQGGAGAGPYGGVQGPDLDWTGSYYVPPDSGCGGTPPSSGGAGGGDGDGASGIVIVWEYQPA